MRNTYTQDCRSIQARYEKLRRVRSRELPARLLPPPLDERDEKEFKEEESYKGCLFSFFLSAQCCAKKNLTTKKKGRKEGGKLKETKET